ncbi:terpene synthase family protein [Kitasatospora sp. NPDC054795]
MERDLLVVLPEAGAHRAELRLWPFDLPFPYRISPWHEQVGAHSRGWVRETGLAPDDTALRRHDRYDMALFACLSYPDAARDGLDLVADWVSWWSIWNDFPDDPDFIGTPGRAEAFFVPLTAVLDSPGPRPEDPQSGGTWPGDPHTRAFADIWRRWCEGMSPAFTARTRENWKHWFAAYLTRCEQRREHALLDVDEYLALREVTGAARLEMDAAERCGRYEVPDDVLGSRLLQRMRHLTAQVINITQDVQSLAKEEAAGDRHNLVIVLEQRHGATREQALTRIHSMTREHTDAFLRAEAELPGLLDHLGIAVERRAPVHRHVADLRSLMRGCFDFCAASGRYR